MASISGHGGQHHGTTEEGLEEMWMTSTRGIQEIEPSVENWKIQTLPLARIKKIMKSEEFVLQELEKDRQHKLAVEEGRSEVVDTEKPSIKFMISGEAPVLMSKACELLIKDLSFRAWTHTERNRRRTLQRQDLHAAVGESEVYDFLIDIVPRVTPATSHKVHSPLPPSIPSVAGLGGVSHGGIAGIPHGVQMQMHTGVHTIIPPSSSLTQGVVVSAQEDAGTPMMQHMGQHHLRQPTQQQASYQYDPTQHASSTQAQHVSQQAHHLHHDQQHQPQQHVQHHGLPGEMHQPQEEGTVHNNPASQQGQTHPAPDLWLHQ